jgi:DNA-binding NarL/FixJ family response regulator
MEKIKVILVDDHRLVREGIKSLLVSDEEITVIGEAASFEELKSVMERITPDIFNLDIKLPDISGIDIINYLMSKNPTVKVIMLTMYTDEDFIFNSVKLGASGYLPKNTTKRELIEAIKTVSTGKEYFSDEIKNILLRDYIRKLKNQGEIEEDTRGLTKREEEILKLCASGLNNKDIAEKLYISIRTVESHKNHIMNKLELKSNVDLIKYALKHKFINV